MGIFLFGEKKKNVIEPTLTSEELEKIKAHLKQFSTTEPTVELIPINLKYYNHLKKMIWKYRR